MAKLYKRSAGSHAPKSQPESLKQWADRYCRERGFDWEFATANGAELVDDAAARQAGFVPYGGILFHSYDPLTKEPNRSGQLRHMRPPVFDGKPRKFSQRKNTTSEPYFARALDWQAAARDTRVPIIVTEGPTRSLAGTKHGMYVVALTGVTCHGTGDDLPAVLTKFKWKGRPVAISYDADSKRNGQVAKAEERLARKLAALQAVVRIVRVPPIAPHAGLDDLLAIDGGAELFRRMCESEPVWNEAEGSGSPVVESLANVESEAVEWIWNGRIARGNLTMFSGDPGSAKTFVALAISADLTRGRIPVTKEKCPPLRVLYASTENSAKHVIGPRFRAMGGDDNRFLLLDGATDAKGQLTGITFANLAPVERAIQEKKIDLVFFDPVQSYFGADADFHKANEVRPRMDSLMRLAAKYNIAIVLIRHLAKNSGGRAIHRGLGSIDFTGAVRVELMIGTRADHPNERAILTAKNNLGEHLHGLGFRIEGTGMDAHLKWTGDTTLTLGDLTAPEAASASHSGINRAIEYLQTALANGPKQASEIFSTGQYSERMLQRAAKLIAIEKFRTKARGPVMWKLRGRGGKDK